MDSKFISNYETIAKAKIIPMPDEFKTYDVKLNLDGGMLSDFISIDYAAIRDKLSSIGASIPNDITEEKFASYVKTIVYSRIAWVNNEYYIIHPNDDIAVPAFISCVLMNVGRASDITTGMTLVPKTDYITGEKKTNAEKLYDLKTEHGLLDKSECFKVSHFLKSVPGLQYSKGYIKDRNGAFSFMSMQMIGDYIKTYTPETHPVYALLSSILEPTIAEGVFSPLVKYGDVNHLRTLLWEVTSV